MLKLRFSAAAVTLAAVLAIPDAAAQAGKPQAHDTNHDGVTAEVVEAVRKDGVLSVKLRFRNSGAKNTRLDLVTNGRVETHYVVAGSTKLLPLKDSKNVALMPPLDAIGGLHPDVKPGGSYLFWTKYPAPPAEIKKVTLYSPIMPPIEDVPITEAR